MLIKKQIHQSGIFPCWKLKNALLCKIKAKNKQWIGILILWGEAQVMYILC